MNTEEKNNYVQYVNRHGIVKAKNVIFEDDGTTTRFTVDGIDEEFFIFAIYQNNIQRFCVGIDNLENTDMLGFINANMVDLSSIPPYAFLQSQTVVQFSYNNEYVQNYKFGAALDSGPSDLPLAADTDDLKYLKSLMKTLYPANVFTFIPHNVMFLNGIPYGNDQPNCLGVNSNTCYFMRFSVNGNLTLDNELSVFKTRDGSYPSLYFSNDEPEFPVLFSGWSLSGATMIFAKGYKVVSDLPLWV
ncbi:hypothetical protein [Flavobacterium daejeonense]|uniref:hypothetical protein n=1 Tax=Flavobacterium daejeonense TaxID=350893 RepID=UPI00047AF3D5|nr:hypothetical protein [Flavobacterium daejeonense]